MIDLENVFKALSDKTRLQMILLLLSAEELCVCDFVEVLGITQSKASRHLRRLVDAGLLNDRREGTWAYFRIWDAEESTGADIVRLLLPLLRSHTSPELLERLRKGRASKHRAERACVSRSTTTVNRKGAQA